jgi:hypothetical protein
MFGTLPAYAVYCRHVRNIRLRNVETVYEGLEQRPALVCDDVEGLEVANSNFTVDRESVCVHLKDARGALFQGCRVRGEAAAFMRLSGAGTNAVSLISNELAKARTAVEYSSGAQENALFAAANHVA